MTRLGVPEAFVSAIRKKNRRIGELAYTYRMCAASFVGIQGKDEL